MSYKVTEPDGTITVYDSNGNFKFKQDPNWSLVPQGYNNSGYSNALVPSTGQNNALTIPGTLGGQSSDGSFGWRDALALAIEIGKMKNPFSSTGKTIGESVAEGGKQAIKWAIDKVTGKNDKAQKTTKPQTQTKTITNPQTQTKTQALTSPIKYQTITYPSNIMDDYERNSIKKFEILQRKSVPWKMPSVEVGITRMTGFEPFSATADQTFNVFYGGGSIDPFLRS